MADTVGVLLDAAIAILEEWLEENKVEDIDVGCDALGYERGLIEAVKMGKEALGYRKWKPAKVSYKLPPREGMYRNRYFFNCPTCGHEIEFPSNHYPSACTECGQVLRWNLREELGIGEETEEQSEDRGVVVLD